jgi:glycosyltransferase involved in cell wall biosynthesis
MPRLVIHFPRFGPYHHARLKSAAEEAGKIGWEVIGLETAGSDATYAWNPSAGSQAGPRIVAAFADRRYDDVERMEMRRSLLRLLGELEPDCVAITGWSLVDSRACHDWCDKNGAQAIVMSETREADGQRVWWKEFLKSRIVRRFDAALVGGKSHRDYLVKLGMPAERIAFGYNVVDNAYFKAESGKLKAEIEVSRRASQSAAAGDVEGHQPSVIERRTSGVSSQLSEFQLSAFPPPFFLASNRFIERKNLSRLIEAYSEYLKRGQESEVRGQSKQEQGTNNEEQSTKHQARPWDLCLLGDGELKADLVAQCQRLGLNVIESAPWEVEERAEGGNLRAEGGDPEAAIRAQASSILQSSGFSPQVSALKFQPSGLSPQPSIYFPGFRQIEELPRFYAHAGCFIHPALEEPWGLVLNEAMACGLPILSGNNVGAAEELVDEGVNGWTFDAEDVDAMARLMVQISAFNFQLSAFGAASARILEERCPTAAFGRGLAELLGEG